MWKTFVSGLARSLAGTGSSIETLFFAKRKARLDQVGQRLKFWNIVMLSEGQMNVFPIDFGLVGFGALPGRNRK